MNDWVNDIHQGDVIERLSEMPESSVHMCMTSPPYFGLRDYGEDGQIGLEDSLDEFIEKLVEVGDELRRVLREDGNWWLNLGDSFAGSGRGQWDNDEGQTKEAYSPDSGDLPDRDVNLRRKNKMLVPHRVAIALQDAGWIVRSDAVWSKPNPMPHPVKDRLNESKEFVFHLTPNPDYWFDLDAIREPHAEVSKQRMKQGPVNADTEGRGTNDDLRAEQLCHSNGKNPGDILEVTTKPFPEAHFAVYPPELCEKPIKSSCPPKVCADCGTPYERDVEREQRGDNTSLRDDQPQLDPENADKALSRPPTDWEPGAAEFKGWEQTCDCETDETKPGIAIDPFTGAGTTCMVAKQQGRRFVGIELNPEYVAMAQKRVGITVDEPEYLLEDGETTLGAFGD